MAARVRSLQKAAHPSRNTDDFNTYFGCSACAADDDTKSVRVNTHANTPKTTPKYVEVPFHFDLQYTDKVARALTESTGHNIVCGQLFQTHTSDDAVQRELTLTCTDDNNQEIVLVTKPPHGTVLHFV